MEGKPGGLGWTDSSSCQQKARTTLPTSEAKKSNFNSKDMVEGICQQKLMRRIVCPVIVLLYSVTGLCPDINNINQHPKYSCMFNLFHIYSSIALTPNLQAKSVFFFFSFLRANRIFADELHTPHFKPREIVFKGSSRINFNCI